MSNNNLKPKNQFQQANESHGSPKSNIVARTLLYMQNDKWFSLLVKVLCKGISVQPEAFIVEGVCEVHVLWSEGRWINMNKKE